MPERQGKSIKITNTGVCSGPRGRHNAEVNILPTYLSRSGYRTATVGKLHVETQEVYNFNKAIDAERRNPVDMAEKSEEFITSSDEPFFLYYCPYDPHGSKLSKTLPHRPAFIIS